MGISFCIKPKQWSGRDGVRNWLRIASEGSMYLEIRLLQQDGYLHLRLHLCHGVVEYLIPLNIILSNSRLVWWDRQVLEGTGTYWRQDHCQN